MNNQPIINVSQAYQKDQCQRHNPFKGSYLQHIDYVEAKIKHGAKQKQCKKCGYWFFKSEY
jgi:hypothetical protein